MTTEVALQIKGLLESPLVDPGVKVTLPTVVPSALRLSHANTILAIPELVGPALELSVLKPDVNSPLTWVWKLSLQVDKPLFPDTQPTFYTVTSDISSGVTASLRATGIVGLYLGIVLAVGRFLRMYVSGISSRIMFENLPWPDRLIRMIQALHLARAEKNLALEETLFRVVIGIYRNPIKLIDVTADPEGRTESYPPAPIDLEAAILGEESSDNEEDDEDDEVYETPVQGSPTT
eukprot:TRINITY_DN2169_c0_g1_i2.p1 TRINITY_DN2169_c0_g1~~TRINITY_DN2169_c0_g1_i2.p1  ORF type:complete len:235 (-),score=36.13 TRINITY_DN2169_c0_g1_i2:13-717(-)